MHQMREFLRSSDAQAVDKLVTLGLERKEAETAVQKVKYEAWAGIPLNSTVCALGCQYKKACPLARAGKQPIDTPCPIEETFTDTQLEILCDSSDISLHTVQNSLAYTQLAGLLRLKWRIEMTISCDDEGLVVKDPVFLGTSGVGERKVAHPLLQVLTETNKSITALMDKQLMTKSAKSKFQQNAEAASKVMSQARQALAKMINQTKFLEASAEAVDGDFEELPPTG